MPKARNALTVRMQSSLGRKPRKVQTPFESAAMIAARCEILLSPGTVISASIRGARLTRNSISPVCFALRNEEDLVGERIFNFCSGRETSHIYQTLISGVWAFHKTGFSRYWRSVGVIPLGGLGRRR